jgi:HK97 family phage prohead protease
MVWPPPSPLPDDEIVASWWRDADARAAEEAAADAHQAERIERLRARCREIDLRLAGALSADRQRRIRRSDVPSPRRATPESDRVIRCRQYTAELEVRDDGRTLIGVAVPYGVETVIVEPRRRYTETFARGAFADAGIHPLMATHPRDGGQLPIGVSVELRDRPDGLHGAWHVSDTSLGSEVMTLVRDGVPLGLSVGFVAGVNRWNREHSRVERVTASLDHVAVVRSPAYASARVHAVRTANG